VSDSDPIDFYLSAKRAVLDAGFGDEVVWQSLQKPAKVTETEFLTEAAWVILSSGMSERVVRSRFPMVAEAFRDFVSADEIVLNVEDCRERALADFRHEGKISGIATCAVQVAMEGYQTFYAKVAADPVATLQGIPYIGPISALHLAKNMGFAVCKPDRHLSRTASIFGMAVDALCESIALWVGDDVRVVDIVLWRYAVMNRARSDWA
jgi:hypothetical protein